jgi:UDP-N-acetylglucosamine transferase subunit ALG13
MKLQGEVFKELTHFEFVTHLNESDVVISHAGVGSILSILDSGKFPILIPRLAENSEHIDNHQLEIASVVSNLNLCTVVTDKLSRVDLIQASHKRIEIRRKR